MHVHFCKCKILEIFTEMNSSRFQRSELDRMRLQVSSSVNEYAASQSAAAESRLEAEKAAAAELAGVKAEVARLEERLMARERELEK